MKEVGEELEAMAEYHRPRLLLGRVFRGWLHTMREERRLEWEKLARARRFRQRYATAVTYVYFITYSLSPEVLTIFHAGDNVYRTVNNSSEKGECQLCDLHRGGSRNFSIVGLLERCAQSARKILATTPTLG